MSDNAKNEASNTNKFHTVLNVTATVTVSTTCGLMVIFVWKLTVEFPTPIRNTEEKNRIYTL